MELPKPAKEESKKIRRDKEVVKELAKRRVEGRHLVSQVGGDSPDWEMQRELSTLVLPSWCQTDS